MAGLSCLGMLTTFLGGILSVRRLAPAIGVRAYLCARYEMTILCTFLQFFSEDAPEHVFEGVLLNIVT